MTQTRDDIMAKTEAEIQSEAARFVRAKPVLDELRSYYRAGRLTMQQFRTLRGQALAGDRDGAIKGLGRLLGL